MKIFSIGILVLIVCAFGSVQIPLSNIQPEHFPDTHFDFQSEPLSAKKVTLGRALFYDPILSADSSISCSSCHSSYNAFAHTDHDLSHGIQDQIGNRNAPALFNLAWQSSFMWDGAVNHLDMQAMVPLTDEKEMAADLPELIKKLNQSSLYPHLFEEAFGNDSITVPRMLKALSQFQLTLVSANAKYDQVILGLTGFNEQEKNGHRLFNLHCNACHTAPLFSSYTYKSNGLAPDTSLNDLGRFRLSNNVKDKYLYKVPSLRNLSYTFPYMHDGRFRSLHEVLDHYNNEASKAPYTSPELNLPMKLSSKDKVDLIAFLKCLNDNEFVFNKKHAYPMSIF